MRHVLVACRRQDIERAAHIHVENLARMLVRVGDRDHRAQVVNLVHAAHRLRDRLGVTQIAKIQLNGVANLRR